MNDEEVLLFMVVVLIMRRLYVAIKRDTFNTLNTFTKNINFTVSKLSNFLLFFQSKVCSDGVIIFCNNNVTEKKTM